MKKFKRILLYFFIFVVIALIYSYIETFWIETKEVTISDKDIPSSFNNTKIVFVSDFHCGPLFSAGRVGDLVKRVNALNPDIILFGGDYIDEETKYIEPCFEELKNLKAPLGKYGVLGNHDHWRNPGMVKQWMKNSGINIMDNNAMWVNKDNDRIKIGGVGALDSTTQDLEPTVNDTLENDFIILLSHDPDYAEQININKIDLVLSGHTHGGQVTLFGLWSPLSNSKYGQKYRSGFAETENTKVFVTKGVGTYFLPLRFFARPEIVLINLVSEE